MSRDVLEGGGGGGGINSVVPGPNSGSLSQTESKATRD